jgi:hypothetical protein
MPIHQLLAEHPVLLAAQQARTAAEQAAARPGRDHAAAHASWQKAAVNALSAGETPGDPPPPPDQAVVRELQRRAKEAGRLVDAAKQSIAAEVETAARSREAELLAEVARYRARLDEIAREGASLAATTEHVRSAGGRLRRSSPGVMGAVLSPDALLKHTATGAGWLGPAAG